MKKEIKEGRDKEKKKRFINAHIKDIIREIKRTWKRFLSILIIMALGVFVLVGLKVTGPQMRQTFEHHISKQKMYDIYISSLAGIDEKDIEAIEKVGDIRDRQYGYYTDVALDDLKIFVRINSLSDKISIPEVIEGRLPEKAGEIALEYTPKLDHIKVGDDITFEKESDKLKEDKDKDDLKNYTYKVVGKIISSDFMIQNQKGISESSSGSLSSVAYVTEDNFDKDNYSFVKYTFNGTENLITDSTKYKKITDGKRSEIKALLEPRAAKKFDEIKQKNKEKIDDAKKKIDDGRKELKDGEQKLKDAEDKINQAKIDIANGRAELEKNERENAQKLEDETKNLENKKAEFNEAKNDYEKGLKKYKDGQAAYQKAYDENFTKLNKAELDLNEKRQKITAGSAEVKAKQKEINDQVAELDEKIVGLNQAIEAKKLQSISTVEEEATLQMLVDKKAEAEEGLEQLNAKITELEIQKNKVEQALSEVENGLNKLAANRKDLDAAAISLKAAQEKIKSGEIQLADGEAKLAEAKEKFKTEIAKNKKKLDDAEKELADSEAEYEKNNKEFLEKKPDVQKKLDDGEKEIADAKELLDKLRQPKFAVDTRNDNDSVFFLFDSSHKLDVVSWIFPVFFFFVAILVSVTTMTRMVDEKRIEIGTYKALGYKTLSISQKFIFYGLFSSAIGGILGAAAGSSLLPKIIYHAYSASFVIKELHGIPDVATNTIAILFGIAVNFIATISVVISSLKSNAAELMRSKPPKKVKKYWIEKITFIWNRLNFLSKVTMRNVFRYRARMFMTIFGIAGCTGLLFLGFSLREAIVGISDKQFNDIFKHDIEIITDDELGDKGKSDYLKFLNSDEVIGYKEAYFEKFNYENELARDQEVTLLVPKEAEGFEDYVSLHKERQVKSPLYYNLDEIVATKKLGSILPIKNKTPIVLEDANLNNYNIKPAHYADNYTGHYIYMSKDKYEEIFDDKYKTNAYLVKLADKDKKEEIVEKLKQNSSILAVMDFNETKMAIDNWRTSVEAVVYIIIICSSILAFVVLFNLSNINIEERKRELSTIKVLGFTTREITQYIYRETYILAIIGIILGYGVGWMMLGAVAEILPPDNLMLNTIISWQPYVFSAFVSLLFTFIVQFAVMKRLRTIDPVASLKAYE